ncbi:MAG TPA: tryptophan-rich sensory protein [Candidatus Absconditabacterales bacterium]|nr:tryptophan-rich sensory protein [Candidatus Absconditabacterales bacterium]
MKIFNFKRRKKPLFTTKILAISNIVAFVAVIIVNYLATSLPIGGMTTGALSDLYPNLFVPAGITFSIWGLIYLGLLGFVVWQIVDLFKKKSARITKKIGIWFLLSCVANISWIFARHYRLVGLSVLIMLIFLAILIIISKKVEIGKKLGNLGDKYFVQVPFSLYLGWISVATIANISTYLVNIGRSGRGISPVSWTIIVIIVAMILALLALYRKRDIVFALVVIRAFLGIILKRLGAEIVYTEIIWITGVAIMIISTYIGYSLEYWKKN